MMIAMIAGIASAQVPVFWNGTNLTAKYGGMTNDVSQSLSDSIEATISGHGYLTSESNSPSADNTFSIGSYDRAWQSLWIGSGDIYYPTNSSAARITTNVVTRWDVSDAEEGDTSLCGVYSNGVVEGSSPALGSGGHATSIGGGLYDVYTYLTKGGTEAYRSSTIQTNYANRNYKVMGYYTGQNGYTGVLWVSDLGNLTNVVVNYTNAAFTAGLIQKVRDLTLDTSNTANRVSILETNVLTFALPLPSSAGISGSVYTNSTGALFVSP